MHLQSSEDNQFKEVINQIKGLSDGRIFLHVPLNKNFVTHESPKYLLSVYELYFEGSFEAKFVSFKIHFGMKVIKIAGVFGF